LYPFCGGWHNELINEAASHADVLFADKILPDLAAYVQQVRSLKNVAKQFEAEEREVLVLGRMREEARLACCCCCCAPWSRVSRFFCCQCFSCGWQWLVGPFRRCCLRRKLARQREARRAELMEAALVQTVDEPTRRRLGEEEALSNALGKAEGQGAGEAMIHQTMFDKFVREQGPQESEASMLSMVAIGLSWAYIAILSWFALSFCVYMEQSVALEWLWGFFVAFSGTLFVFTPLTIFINQVYLPSIVVDRIVLPELQRQAQQAQRQARVRARNQNQISDGGVSPKEAKWMSVGPGAPGTGAEMNSVGSV
jgi:hypothetical protein